MPLGTCEDCSLHQTEETRGGKWRHGELKHWYCDKCFYKHSEEEYKRGNYKGFSYPVSGCEWCGTKDVKWHQGSTYTCLNPDCSKEK